MKDWRNTSGEDVSSTSRTSQSLTNSSQALRTTSSSSSVLCRSSHNKISQNSLDSDPSLSFSLSLSFPPLKHPLQASYPRHSLGGKASSSMAYSLVDDSSSHLFSFIFCCVSMVENHHWRTSLKLKDPASIEDSQVSFHQVVIRAQELQVGAP